MALHSTLTGSDLHEPKGIESATLDSLYVADGAGSGNWALLNVSNLDNSFKNPNSVFLSGQIPDLSTPGSSYEVPVPVDMTINSITYTLANNISVGNGIFNVTNPGVGIAATVTVPFSGSTTGTTSIINIATNNDVVAGSHIEVAAVAGSTTTCKMSFVIRGTMT